MEARCTQKGRKPLSGFPAFFLHDMPLTHKKIFSSIRCFLVF